MEPMDLLAFKVVIEPDEDLWQSYYPAWEHLGAATFGSTIEEAAVHIKEVLQMIVEEIEEGGIEWPIAPCPPWEFSRPSIQDAPELVQFKCDPEHPDVVASHGGLPITDLEPGAAHNEAYRLIYVAMEDALASIHQRETWRANRTGGRAAKVFGPPTEKVDSEGKSHYAVEYSNGSETIRNNRELQARPATVSDE